jgi:hypothetical protein
MKKNPGRKERRALQFKQQDKYSIALEIVQLKKAMVKSKQPKISIVAKQVHIDMDKPDSFTRDSVSQTRAMLKRTILNSDDKSLKKQFKIK